MRRGSVGFVQLARDTVTGSAVAIKFVEREHPSLAAGLLLREIGNQVSGLHSLLACRHAWILTMMQTQFRRHGGPVDAKPDM